MIPYYNCCCDCARTKVGFETNAKVGTVIFFEGYFCCSKGGNALTYCGKCAGKDVILLNDGRFVPYTEDLKFVAGKAAMHAPAQQAMK